MRGTVSLGSSGVLRFACVSGCSAPCCQGHAIALSPYEVLRLGELLRLSSEELEERYLVAHYEESGVPLLMLERSPCRFLVEGRCTVYPARPLACRLYPAGLSWKGGLEFRLSQDGRCPGMGRGEERTLQEYILQQDAWVYIKMWERWVEFVERAEESELSANPLKQVFLKILLYNYDVRMRDEPASPEERFLHRIELAEMLVAGHHQPL